MDPRRISISSDSSRVQWPTQSFRPDRSSLHLIASDHEGSLQNPRLANTSSSSSTQNSADSNSTAAQKNRDSIETAESHRSTQPRTKNRLILLDWWEEILSVVIAVVCTALSVAVLVYMNGRSLNEWRLRPQPNTLIALLATLTRAALIYPLAECLGHLKWRYFERPQTLARVQTFDAASRGPLGAVKYLWTLPWHSPLATCAALLTTLLLLFQPFAQQTINFASRLAPMPNETAHVFRATSWNMSSFANQDVFAEPLFPALSFELYKSISKDAKDGSNNGQCTTTSCQFADFTTLAVCSECEQRELSGRIDDLYGRCVWQSRTRNLGTSDPTFFEQYGSSENSSQSPFAEAQELNGFKYLILDVQCGGFDLAIHRAVQTTGMFKNGSHTTVGIYPFGISASRPWAELEKNSSELFTNLKYAFGSGNPISTSDSRNAIWKPPKDGLFNTCGFEVPPSGIHNSNIILNSTCLSFDTDLKLWFSGNDLSSQFGFLNATETFCSLMPCVQHVTEAKIQNNQFFAQVARSDTSWRYSNATEEADKFDREERTGPYCAGDDSNCSYNWTTDALIFLGSLINSTIDTESFYTMYNTRADSPGNNYTMFYERVAAQVSAILQSRANPDIVNVTGVAYGTEVFVQVNWLWFILPLVLLAASLLVIVLSIWDSSRKNYLFKNNFLAAIAFELQGWEPHEYGVDATWARHSMRLVEEKAERMVVRMHLPQDGDGGLRLKKE